ncbi:MAG: S8 family serine peptidase [Flavobacteriaceae bacterium]
MKKITLLRLLSTVTFLLISISSYSQDKDVVNLRGEHIQMIKNINDFQWNAVSNKISFENGFYGCLRFSKIPSQDIQDDLKKKNLNLTDYMGDKTYLFYFPEQVSVDYLKSIGVISIISVPNSVKKSLKIKSNAIGAWAKEGDKILINAQYYKNVAPSKFVNEISKIHGVSVKEHYKGSNIITLLIDENRIDDLVDLPIIKWVELIPEPSVKEDLRGKSIHRSSNLDTQTISGRNYTGEDIGVLVRDDGIVGPHIDFEGRINNSSASGTGQTHGDGVAGILTGAGNLDPTKRGMAAGANLFVVNYVSSFLDASTTSLIGNGDVQITNSSYGNGCNAGYTTIAQTVDTQTTDTPSLLHVFSAGNSNGNDCGYGAGDQWGNITGGHKQGKNVIATANVFYNGVLANSSSHGPAQDGRIKPDITAHGQGQLSTDENNEYLSFGGTSGAAPGIAGVSAQLYQAYKDLNSNQLPESALIKATLLNTANDYGNVGPDFKFGWGLVNGLRAAMLLEDGRYLDDQITQGSANNHTISVPVNTKEVRFMLYWSDPAATPGAVKALVNDLDIKVTSPSAVETLPWTLSTIADPTFLDRPATRGVDRLNNMEQVLIDNPEAGDYTINVAGFEVPVGPQKYYIVYEIITEELTITYPNGNEKLVPGENEAIHWDAINTTEDFILEYTTDDGSNWNNIATVSSTSTNYTWAVPQTVSGEYKIRITSGSFSDTSDETFSIAKLVTGVDISQKCLSNISVVWDEVPGATSYDVYMLGDKFMEKMGTTSGTSFSISIPSPANTSWVAVSAKGGNGWESRRSIAINREGISYNCSLSNDLTAFSINNDFSALDLLCTGSNSINVSAKFRNIGTASQTNFTVSYQLNSEAIVQETFTGTIDPGGQEIFTFSTPLDLTADGMHTLKAWVSLAGDEMTANDETQTDFYAQILSVGLNEVEDFETSGYVPIGWNTVNPDNAATWTSNSVTASNSTTTTAPGIDNFNYNAAGQEDAFETLVYDLSGSGLALSFDLAKAQYSAALSDGLRVEISTDCGQSYTAIYDKDGLDLSTINIYSTSIWTPSASDWRTEVIDLSAYQNQKAKFRFVNVNGYGNTTIIDNIVVTGTLSTKEDDFDINFSLFPNPVKDEFTVRSKQVRINKVSIYNMLGAVLLTEEIKTERHSIAINTASLSRGVYLVRLESELGAHFKKIVKN